MPLNLAAMERKLAEMTDIEAIRAMTAEERAQLLANYKTAADRLGLLAEQATEAAHLGEGLPGYQTLRAISRLVRAHRSAVKSYERIEQAIAKAEKAGQGLPTGLTTIGRRNT